MNRTTRARIARSAAAAAIAISLALHVFPIRTAHADDPVPPNQAAQPVPQQLDESRVVALALRAHPVVQSAEFSRDAAESAATAADLARLPNLKVSGRYARLSSIPVRFRSFGDSVFPQILDNIGAHANVSIPLTDTFFGLAASARAAGRTADAASIEVISARAQVAYEARVAFFDFWSRSLAVENATELVRAAENNAADQRRRQDAGTVAKNEVLPFETALDDAVMKLESARGDLTAAEATLRSFLPDLRDAKLSVPSLSFEHDDVAPIPPAPAAAANPPRLAALDMQARAADARADAASYALLPKLSAYGNLDYAAPNPRVFVMTRLIASPTWEVGVQLEWSLDQLTTGNYAAKQARAEHGAMVAKLVDARRRLDAERDGARGILDAAQRKVSHARARVEHANALAKARRGELDAGTALALNVVLAETDLARAKNEYVDAFVERALARAKLDFVDGRAEPVATGGVR